MKSLVTLELVLEGIQSTRGDSLPMAMVPLALQSSILMSLISVDATRAVLGLYHFRARVDRVTEFEAHIDVFEPGRRLRLIYLPNAGLPQSDSAMVDDFILDADGSETIVRLLGSGVPSGEEWDAIYMRLRIGWERAMARLKVLVEKT